MKNADLTTIISGVLGVALIAMAAVILLYEPGNIIFAGSLVAGALGLNGYNAALLAPSPKQAEQVAQAVAASTPQVPLVSISHPATSAPDIQVSSAAFRPIQQQGPQPIMLQPTTQPASQPMNTFASQQQTQPQEQMMTSAPGAGQVIPFPQQQSQQQQVQGDWRNWTAMTQVPPPTQQP